MKRLIYSIFTIAILSTAWACGGDSYEKRLKKERRAIEDFLNAEGIEILETYPDDHIFGEKQYYREGTSGVYLRVEKPGKVEEALKEGEIMEVVIRFDSVKQLVRNSYLPGNKDSDPLKFVYGDNSTYLQSASNVGTYFMSPACVIPLSKGVGTGAKVSLIVPFLNGSSYQRNYYEPFFFTDLSYTYYRQVGGDESDTDIEG